MRAVGFFTLKHLKMSIGLDCIIEVKNNGKWEEHEFMHREPLAYDYGIFSYDALTFLTGMKNESKAPTIGEDKYYRGYPEDSDWLNEEVDGFWGKEKKVETLHNDNNHSISYVTLKELLEFDYEIEFENLNNSNFSWNTDKRRSLEVGEGYNDTVRNWLCKSFFDALDYLNELGKPEDVRVIYWLS